MKANERHLSVQWTGHLSVGLRSAGNGLHWLVRGLQGRQIWVDVNLKSWGLQDFTGAMFAKKYETYLGS